MKAATSGKGKINMGYEVPAEGIYLWTFGDDVQISMSDDVRNGGKSGPKSFQAPLTIAGVIEGDAKEGQKANLFINLVDKTGEPNPVGEAQLMELLNIVGVFEELQKKVGDNDFDPTSSAGFHQFLATALPGKVIKAKHSIGEWNDKPNMNWETLEGSGETKDDEKPTEVKGDWS